MRGYDRTEWACLGVIAGTIVLAPFFPKPWSEVVAFPIILGASVILVRHMLRTPS